MEANSPWIAYKDAGTVDVWDGKTEKHDQTVYAVAGNWLRSTGQTDFVSPSAQSQKRRVQCTLSMRQGRRHVPLSDVLPMIHDTGGLPQYISPGSTSQYLPTTPQDKTAYASRPTVFSPAQVSSPAAESQPVVPSAWS